MTGIRKQHGRDKRANPPATWLATALKAATRRLLIFTPQMRGPGPRKGWYLDQLADMLSLRASLNLINVLIHNCPVGAAAAVKHLGVSNFEHYTISPL